MIALALRWWYVLAIAGLALVVGVQQMRIVDAHADMAEHLAQDARDREAAITAARTEETRRQAAIDEEATRARNESKERETAIAELADTADGLRNTVAEYQRRARTACAAPAVRGAGQPSAGPSNLLADLYLGSVQANRELAAFADRLRGAGSACERSADALAQPAQH